jgi:hypothetical protein
MSAKRNDSFQKRAREARKEAKREEKLRRKQERQLIKEN